MPIATDRPGAIDTRLLAALPTEAVQPVSPSQGITPGVSDLLKGFREGFITVDDIQKRLADRPVDESNRMLQLQANDFKSRQMTEAVDNAPARLALQADKERVEALRLKVLEKNLNAEDEGFLAKQKHADALTQWERDRVSPDQEVRRKAQTRDADFAAEAQYTAITGTPPPEFIELNEAAKPLSETDWLSASMQPYIEKYVQDNPPAFQLNGTPDAADLLRIRKEGEAQFFKDSRSLYDAYKTTLAQKNGVAYQGTPDYYKALRERINNRQEAIVKQGLGLKAEEARVMNSVKPPDTKVTKTSRINVKGQEEEVNIITDATGNKVGETILSTNAPKLTEVQAKTQKFVSVMEESDRVLAKLEAKGFDPTAASTTVQAFKLTPNRFRSDEVQSYVAARDSWIAAHLRDVSGAAISNPEYPRAAKQFFPQDGDSAATVLEKQARRRAVEDEMRHAQGPTGAPVAAATPAAASNPYEAVLGKRIRTADGREGVVTKRADGTYFLQ